MTAQAQLIHQLANKYINMSTPLNVEEACQTSALLVKHLKGKNYSKELNSKNPLGHSVASCKPAKMQTATKRKTSINNQVS